MFKYLAGVATGVLIMSPRLRKKTWNQIKKIKAWLETDE